MSPVSGDTVLYNHEVDTLQDDIEVINNENVTSIEGYLYYITKGLTNSGNLSGSGHFLALEFSSDDWDEYDNIVVGIEESGDFPLVDIKDYADKRIVYKITDKTKPLVIQTWKDGVAKTTQYGLNYIELGPKQWDPILVEPVPGDVTLYGHQVSSLQRNMDVFNKNINGKLKFISGGLEQSGPLSQDGHYLALQFSSYDWDDYTDIQVGIKNSTDFPTTSIKNLQDKRVVFRIDASTQQIEVKTQKPGIGFYNTTTYSLQGIELLPHYYDPITAEAPSGSEQVSFSDYQFTVSDLQSNIQFNATPGSTFDGEVTGELKYQSNGIGNNAPFNQPGYYLCLKLDSNDWNNYENILVRADNPQSDDPVNLKSGTGTHYGVIRVESVGQLYNVYVYPYYAGGTMGMTYNYDLSGLTLQAH